MRGRVFVGAQFSNLEDDDPSTHQNETAVLGPNVIILGP